ncbi:hypothetical protein AMAG_01664 [Allomyces macrogynus ATCC 38327]|uniref:Ubiquitin-like domain-containing protein n=1 Tax=Allomyces macrogynus (strain ATCC 38327) TaxID=578462 RepID=A0A0L0S0E0_ALLM3|nr:hypothetical protein AMAG_01664 [Allomyces macrogynus ATCC 38327]|eukprot:KNE55789.1 hypothetical protein AMAG_01664 [Allomyces macrogynus ATCC 38327]
MAELYASGADSPHTAVADLPITIRLHATILPAPAAPDARLQQDIQFALAWSALGRSWTAPAAWWTPGHLRRHLDSNGTYQSMRLMFGGRILDEEDRMVDVLAPLLPLTPPAARETAPIVVTFHVLARRAPGAAGAVPVVPRLHPVQGQQQQQSAIVTPLSAPVPSLHASRSPQVGPSSAPPQAMTATTSSSTPATAASRDPAPVPPMPSRPSLAPTAPTAFPTDAASYYHDYYRRNVKTHLEVLAFLARTRPALAAEVLLPHVPRQAGIESWAATGDPSTIAFAAVELLRSGSAPTSTAQTARQSGVPMHPTRTARTASLPPPPPRPAPAPAPAAAAAPPGIRAFHPNNSWFFQPPPPFRVVLQFFTTFFVQVLKWAFVLVLFGRHLDERTHFILYTLGFVVIFLGMTPVARHASRAHRQIQQGIRAWFLPAPSADGAQAAPPNTVVTAIASFVLSLVPGSHPLDPATSAAEHLAAAEEMERMAAAAGGAGGAQPAGFM